MRISDWSSDVCSSDLADGEVAFVVDLTYAGIFGLRNVPQEHIQPFLLGEAPRILFPFARRVLADAVRDGGFQPLLLEPIDFSALYLQQAEAQQQPDTDRKSTRLNYSH